MISAPDTKSWCAGCGNSLPYWVDDLLCSTCKDKCKKEENSMGVKVKKCPRCKKEFNLSNIFINGGFRYKKLCTECFHKLSDEDEQPQPRESHRPEKTIREHEGKKYLRTIFSAADQYVHVEVDVYAVLEAFNVTCPGRQQAIKKLLCAGLRGKGSQIDDLVGAMAALNRAIELQRGRENKEEEGVA